jgi:sugar lactone lactonase YvrE
MTVVDFNNLPGGRILADKLIFPECPRFHDGRIYIVDGPAVRRFDLAGNVDVVAQLPTMMLLGLHIEPDGTIYTGAAFDRTIHRVRDGQTELVADLSGVVETPNNELVVLPSGAMLVGNMGFFILKGEAPVPCGLYRVPRHGNIARTGPDIIFPNGMVLLDGGRKLLVAGGMGSQVWTLDLAEDGEVIGSKVLELTANGPKPSADGIARAADGSLWYGDMHHGHAVLCNPDGSQRITVRGAMNHVTAVWLFEAEGQEWLAMTGLMALAMPASPEDFSARLAIAPLTEILSAAG